MVESALCPKAGDFFGGLYLVELSNDLLMLSVLLCEPALMATDLTCPTALFTLLHEENELNGSTLHCW